MAQRGLAGEFLCCLAETMGRESADIYRASFEWPNWGKWPEHFAGVLKAMEAPLGLHVEAETPGGGGRRTDFLLFEKGDLPRRGAQMRNAGTPQLPVYAVESECSGYEGNLTYNFWKLHLLRARCRVQIHWFCKKGEWEEYSKVVDALVRAENSVRDESPFVLIGSGPKEECPVLGRIHVALYGGRGERVVHQRLEQFAGDESALVRPGSRVFSPARPLRSATTGAGSG